MLGFIQIVIQDHNLKHYYQKEVEKVAVRVKNGELTKYTPFAIEMQRIVNLEEVAITKSGRKASVIFARLFMKVFTQERMRESQLGV